MPPRKKKAVAAAPASRPRRSTRQATVNNKSTTNNGVPDVYQEMLAEAATAQADDFPTSPRPSKKPRVSFEQTADVDELFESSSPPPPSLPKSDSEKAQEASAPLIRPQQVVYDDFEGSSEESDIEFEDVELEPSGQATSEDRPVREKPLQIDLSKSALETPKRTVQRRKPVSKAERLMRLDVHKWHLLSLIGHGLYRNDWCNSEEVHSILKPLVPRKIIKLLHVDETKPQYERNYSFNKGVEEICILWRDRWTITVHGLHKAYWREGADALAEADEGEDLDFDDFKRAAKTCRGSRDLGAQLFTALLRSIAVDARLVFSLQVLPFTGGAKADTPIKPKAKPDYIHAPAQDYGTSAITTSPFAQPQPRPKKSKKIIDSPFPIFWTEILNPSGMWTPLDPVVRNTMSKPKTQFEPPLSDNLNNMTYVIAYEEDNSVHDVTRRYTQWYNAKTRKLRVESTKNGDQWYASALSVFQKKLPEPRDELEADELANRANSEGMPHNIQDFKNHPVYVLERHMRANEVLSPKREVGKVNVGTAKSGKIEPVYRRQDVHLCRTADAWYRRGRDVKIGEQPLKVVVPKSQRNNRGRSADLSDDEDEENRDGVGLYAEFQTSIYEPPPVVDGQIPKNAYGNLDVYVPSMIPPGAVHLSHTLAAAASKLIGIDFADAVTGFEFKGRQGTAVINGVVVAEEFTAAVAAVIDGLEVLGSQEVQEARSKILSGVWKRMLQALRVRERVEAEYGPAKDTEPEDTITDEDDDDPAYVDQKSDNGEGGGFMLEDEATEEKVQEQAVNLQIMKAKMPTVLPEEIVRVPIKVTRSPHKSPLRKLGRTQTAETRESNDDLFEDQDSTVDTGDGGGGGFIPADADETETGGGFIPEDDDDDTGNGGGFIADESSSITIQPNTLESKLSSCRTVPPPSSKTTSSDPSIIPNNLDPDTLLVHSDTEEDTALQLAIARSLTTSTSKSDSKSTAPKQPDPCTPSHDLNSDKREATEEAATTTSTHDNTNETPPPKLPPEAPTEPIEPPTEPIEPPTEIVPSSSSSQSHSPTSLLSHDPNEDEEEPVWLNDALDE